MGALDGIVRMVFSKFVRTEHHRFPVTVLCDRVDSTLSLSQLCCSRSKSIQSSMLQTTPQRSFDLNQPRGTTSRQRCPGTNFRRTNSATVLNSKYPVHDDTIGCEPLLGCRT